MTPDQGREDRLRPPARPPGEDSISAVRRGPDSVFVHWECSGPRSAEVMRELGDEAQWILRVLNMADGTSRRIRVPFELGSHYVSVSPGQTYGFELAATAHGKWRTVCRTGRVAMPLGRAKSADAPGRPMPAGQGRLPAAGPAVPGLHFATTPMRLGSSPGIARPPSA